MSSDNKIIGVLVYIRNFIDTSLGLDRKFMNMYNCSKYKEFEEAHGALFLSLLNVRCSNWSVPQCQQTRLNVKFVMHVATYFDIAWLCRFTVCISTYQCPTLLYGQLTIYELIFVHLDMFIFLYVGIF